MTSAPTLPRAALTGKGNLTEGDVGAHLWRLSLPMLWGIGAIVSFQLVDTYYISRLGTDALAAMSFTFPVTFTLFNIIMGFSIAMSSVAARMIGSGDYDDVQRVTTHAITLVAIVSSALALLGYLALDPIFTAMGATPVHLSYIKDFMHIWFAGAVCVSIPMVGNAAFRASGDAVTPSVIMIVAAVANAIFAPIFIFGLFGMPRLELRGAAMVTVAANGAAMIVGLYFLWHKYHLISLTHVLNLQKFGDSCRRILTIAVPAGVTNVLTPVVGAYITHLLAKTGAEAVAAYGIAMRVEAFIFIPVMAVAVGMAPIVGQNWGAHKRDRVRQVIDRAIGFSITWSLAVAFILVIAARPLASVFSDDALVVHYTSLFFLIVPVSYIFANLLSGWGTTFNAMGKPHLAFIGLFGRMVVFLIPAVTFGYGIAQVTGVFLAIAIVGIITGLAVHAYGRYLLRQQQ